MHNYKTALILGCGRSGRAAEELLRSEGTQTLILDERSSDAADFELCVADFGPEIAIVSPGFSLDHPWVKALAARGIPLRSELELGWSRRHCPVIAVTGSNGKSTVVKWIADALTQAGQPAIPCGNYGFPVCAAVMLPEEPDWLIMEVSSFQLETVQEFHPQIGVLLNVLPNHLDRHGDLETYRNLKLRLFECMNESGTAVFPNEFFQTVEENFPTIGKISFGTEEGVDYRFVDGRVGEVDLRGTYFDNEVLGAAAAAVAAVGEACGLSPEGLASSARSFVPLPHRMQTIAEIGGVRFVDDSKATNLAAMCAALRMSGGRVHLIAGGRAKESDFSLAKDLLAQQVNHLYLIGEASTVMASVWEESVECVLCQTLERAVSAAWERAEPGDTVLLSPACTSFDQFCSFAERGEVFAREVRRLAAGDVKA